MRLFLKDADFEAFGRNILKTLESRPMRICAYCLLFNHWHLVLWPQRDGDLEVFRRSLTRGQPYGSETWVEKMVEPLGLESTLRARGRPRKKGS